MLVQDEMEYMGTLRATISKSGAGKSLGRFLHEQYADYISLQQRLAVVLPVLSKIISDGLRASSWKISSRL